MSLGRVITFLLLSGASVLQADVYDFEEILNAESEYQAVRQVEIIKELSRMVIAEGVYLRDNFLKEEWQSQTNAELTLHPTSVVGVDSLNDTAHLLHSVFRFTETLRVDADIISKIREKRGFSTG
ncbi:hypothetical protein A3738_11420 [Oleiphilus sp. HI0066]|nr:hypothetical protein A3738_11420 [Oleiphilus sp. HI0066]